MSNRSAPRRKEYRKFGGKKYKHYPVYFNTKSEVKFDAGIKRDTGYAARITQDCEDFWHLWLRKK